MSNAQDALGTLRDLTQFLASGTFENKVSEQLAALAGLIGADSCSIMLLNTGAAEDLRMSIHARYGDYSDAAMPASVACGEGIAGHVLATGESVCVDDIAHSVFASLSRRGCDARGGFMCVPINIGGKITGVLNATVGHEQTPFGEIELRLFEVAALFIGKSIQVQQLQQVLGSRFTQLALLQESNARLSIDPRTAFRQPSDVVRILARSFFREMRKAGFSSAQVVTAATELIEQLKHDLSDEQTIA